MNCPVVEKQEEIYMKYIKQYEIFLYIYIIKIYIITLIQGCTATMRYGVTRRSTKRSKHTKNLSIKNQQIKGGVCLILRFGS